MDTKALTLPLTAERRSSTSSSGTLIESFATPLSYPGRIEDGVPSASGDSSLEAMAGVVVAVMDGLQFQWLLDPDLDMVRRYRVLSDLIAGQLGVPPDPDVSPGPG